MKNWQEVSDQYIIESLKKGDFLSTTEIDNNENIDSTSSTIINNFGSLSSFQFSCMCEVATWTLKDIDEFMKSYEIETKWGRNRPSNYRII